MLASAEWSKVGVKHKAELDVEEIAQLKRFKLVVKVPGSSARIQVDPTMYKILLKHSWWTFRSCL